MQQQLGELGAAREHARRATAIFQRTLGPDHPHTLSAQALLRSLEP